MRRIVFGLGAAQVAADARRRGRGNGARPASTGARDIALGGAVAMSSTAIVSKMLADKLELDSLHGRQVIGILLFQDLAVVPLLILIPALAGAPGDMAVGLSWRSPRRSSCWRSCSFFGQRLDAPVVSCRGHPKSSELFVLNVLLITLGLGVYHAIGGLVAGARRIHRRHADFGDRIPLPGRGRHQAVPRRVAGIVFRDYRHEAQCRARS